MPALIIIITTSINLVDGNLYLSTLLSSIHYLLRMNQYCVSAKSEFLYVYPYIKRTGWYRILKSSVSVSKIYIPLGWKVKTFFAQDLMKCTFLLHCIVMIYSKIHGMW